MQKALKRLLLEGAGKHRGKEKAQTKHLSKKCAKKAPKQTNLTGLKKPGEPPASPATEPLQIQVSSRRPRLSSDPEEKRKLNTTIEQKQKKTCTKVHGPPHTELKHTRAKAKPKKPKPNACAEHLRGQGEQKGAKNRHRQKEPSHP